MGFAVSEVGPWISLNQGVSRAMDKGDSADPNQDQDR